MSEDEPEPKRKPPPKDAWKKSQKVGAFFEDDKNEMAILGDNKVENSR